MSSNWRVASYVSISPIKSFRLCLQVLWSCISTYSQCCSNGGIIPLVLEFTSKPSCVWYLCSSTACQEDDDPQCTHIDGNQPCARISFIATQSGFTLLLVGNFIFVVLYIIFVVLYIIFVVLYIIFVVQYIIFVVLYIICVVLYIIFVVLYIIFVVLYIKFVVLYIICVVLYIIFVVLYIIFVVLYIILKRRKDGLCESALQ